MNALLRSALATCLALVLLAFDQPLQAQSLTTVRLAAVPIDVSGEAYYGVEMGFFKRAGLDVQLTSMDNGAAIAPAVASGSVDIGSTNFVSLATAHERGIPLVFLWPAGMYTSKAPTIGVLVAKGSPITSAHDLVGKTVAIDSLKNIAHITLAAWLDKNGVDAGQVKFVEMQFPQMLPALAAGRIDAGVMAEPFVTLAAQTDTILARNADAIGHDFLIGAYYTTADYAKAHPDVVRKFAAAMAQTARWANQHPDAAEAILTKYAKGKPPAGVVHPPFPDRVDMADAQPLIDAAAKYGVLQKSFPVAEMAAPGLTVSAR